MTRSVVHGKFLILSKDGVNEIFKNEEEYSYKIIQIEHSIDNDYIVEVMEKSSNITTMPLLNLNKILTKNKCGE